jgi:hypothetical protein
LRYWREITDALSPAEEILILGHGKGKAGAARQWIVCIPTSLRGPLGRPGVRSQIPRRDHDDG